MPFIFVELSFLRQSSRLELFVSHPQPIEEILLYYLCPICPAKFYNELDFVVGTIENHSQKSKMTQLFLSFGLSAAFRQDAKLFTYDKKSKAKEVPTYKILPPTDRLGGLYDDTKLKNVLSGIQDNKPLPPVIVQDSKDKRFDYEVVDGIHRYYASVKLGYGKIPVVIVE